MSADARPAGGARVVVAANRGPVAVGADQAGADTFRRGQGGLVSGVQDALAAMPDALWVCAALNDRERALCARLPGGRLSSLPAVAAALPGRFGLRMLAVDSPTFRDAYQGVANAMLWFVVHMLFEPARTPVFDAAWRTRWAAYRRYNTQFAEAIAAEAAPDASVLIQDYHLFLVPRLLRGLRPDVRIAHFTHTPWVPPEYFRMLPDDVARELLAGLLAADLLGFHTPRWAALFSACCREVLGVEPGGVRAFPLGVDPGELRRRGRAPQVQAAAAELRSRVGGRLVIGRVDRTEPSKNVPRGLLAYRELLRTRPQWRNRVVHVVCDYPSRQNLPEYRAAASRVRVIAREIVDELGTPDWTPVILQLDDDYSAALATLQLSDVVLVNPIRDGMNLVVLEAVVLSDREPVIVLSREAGAATTLGDDALLVNPFDVTQTAGALHEALSLPAEDRRRRIGRMRAAAAAMPPAVWLHRQLAALGERV